jgi:PAS domain S-box-containing protein
MPDATAGPKDRGGFIDDDCRGPRAQRQELFDATMAEVPRHDASPMASNVPYVTLGDRPRGGGMRQRLDTKAGRGKSFTGMTRDDLVRALRVLTRETRTLRAKLEEAHRSTGRLREVAAADHDRQLELDALQRLHRVDEHFFRDRPSRQILDEILDAAIAIAGADFGSVQIIDPDTKDLRIVTHRGFPAWWVDYWNKAPAGHGACGTALRNGQRVIVEDVEKSSIFIGTPELEIQRKAGVRAVQSTPLLNREGAPLGMISTHFKRPGRPSDRALRMLDLLARQAADLLERIDAEAALRLSEAKFSGIVSIAPDAIITLDETGGITTWNDGARKIYGYSRSDAVGLSLYDLVPARFRATYRGYLEQFMQGRDSSIRMDESGMTFCGVRKSGEEFPADAAISKLEIDGQRIITIAIRDITEQKRLEAQQHLLAELGKVLASRLDYEDTLTNIVHLVVRDLADYAVLYILRENGAVRRARAASRDASPAWHVPVLVETQIDAKPEHPAARVTTTKQPILLDATPDVLRAFAHSEEHLRAIRAVDLKSIMGVPLLVGNSCFGALFFKSRTRRYVPKDLPLAGEIGRRTAMLIENAKLHMTARQAIRARDDVLAIVAHDLRNPLGTVLMEAGTLTLAESLPGHGPREAGTAISRAANRMKRLISDLLDVTRIESGKLSLERTKLPVAKTVADFVADRKALPSSPAPEIHLELSASLGDVFADRDRLLQVLENLVTNAEKFTKPSGTVTVGASPSDHEVVFHVRDTGRGIDCEDLPHVFDRFGPRKRTDRRGTGLGLPIVKGIVEAHGGRVWANSRVGEGSVFFFSIPRARTTRATDSAPVRAHRHRTRSNRG